jgi:hypothetical protein
MAQNVIQKEIASAGSARSAGEAVDVAIAIG